jgi:G3E family GTPase
MADVVVINKTDLLETSTELICAEIKKSNPFAEIKETTFCNFNFELGNLAINKYYFTQVKTMPRPDINSMVIKSGKKISKKSLEIFLNEWAPKAYRIKGFVNLKEGKTAAVQCSFHSVEIIEIENAFHPTEIIALSDQFTLKEWNGAFKRL